MSNSIDLNVRGDNSMSNLDFYWIAEFEDDCIFQFEVNGTETKFKEVQNRFDSLKYFTLQHKEKELSFTVDLTLGIITSNKKAQIIEENKIKKNIRLIYFRRNRVELTSAMKEIVRNITYHLGFQYQDENNNNHKIILQIDNNGGWILGE
jgi:hypothetical protein